MLLIRLLIQFMIFLKISEQIPHLAHPKEKIVPPVGAGWAHQLFCHVTLCRYTVAEYRPGMILRHRGLLNKHGGLLNNELLTTLPSYRKGGS